MKLVDLLFSYLEEDEETKKEESLVDFDPNSKILRPRDFLRMYKIEPLSYISINLSYALSENQNKEILISTQEVGVEEKTKTNITSENVMQFLKDFKNQLETFAKDAPPTFSIIFEWASKANINERFQLKISIKNKDNKIKIGSLSDYSETNNKNPKIKDSILKFIKSKEEYIRNSPINLLASIMIYNDWKYNWNVDDMQKDLKNREK